MKIPKLTDEEIVTGLLQNDNRIIQHFFYEKCSPLFIHIIRNIFDYRIDKNELISELFIYLSENDWQRLRQFDCRCKLTTWFSTVAVRFFWKKRGELIENRSESALYVKEEFHNPHTLLIQYMDIEALLDMMPNTRYREAIHSLFIKDMEPQHLADEMGITVDNLYNLKRRALQQIIKLGINE